MKSLKIIAAMFVLLVIVNVCPYDVSAQVVTTVDGLKFDAEYYGRCNPEIVATYGNSFEGLYRHFLEHGKEEGRLPYEGYVRNDPGNQAPNPQGAPLGCTSINNNVSRIYVGDSRTYIMHNVIGDDGASWIGFPGTKYDTFATTASSYIDNIPLAGKQIVILYGINDITTYGAQQTFDYYNYFLNGKAQDWIRQGAKVYFVSLVGIGNELVTNGKKVKPGEVTFVNNQVATFNALMAGFPANINKINISAGANPFYDGIHYNIETCKSIYQQINRCL